MGDIYVMNADLTEQMPLHHPEHNRQSVAGLALERGVGG
jgi:hypothetical protein